MIEFDSRTSDTLRKHFHDVAVFAKGNARRHASFRQRVQYLNSYGSAQGKTRCVLYKDFAPYSFTFDLYRCLPSGEERHLFYGGLIYHEASDEWGVHT